MLCVQEVQFYLWQYGVSQEHPRETYLSMPSPPPKEKKKNVGDIIFVHITNVITCKCSIKINKIYLFVIIYKYFERI